MAAIKVKKILVIRFSSIGDIVLTTPIIRCLKNQTGAEIHFLTKRSFRSLLEPNPNISKIWSLEDSLDDLLPELKAHNYDYIVDLHKNLRSFKVRRFLKKPGGSFPKINLQKWLAVNLKLKVLPEQHIVERYFEAVKGLGVKYDGKGLDHYFPEGLSLKAKDHWGAKLPSGLICLAVGGAHATKRLPIAKLKSLCIKIESPMVLIGGPDDSEIGEKLADIDPKRILNQCGLVSLHESAAWIRESAVLISHDTGMMHIGAALKTRIISIWGNTVPEFGMYPFYPDGMPAAYQAEVAGLSCRPCSKIGFNACPKGHFSCMQDQDLDRVIDEVVNAD